MKRDSFKLLLAAAVGGGSALLLGEGVPALSWGGLNAPFLWYGSALRNLSLSGFWGNLAAWAAVLFVSALPLLILRKKGGWERSFPVLAAAVLLAGQYFLVNPTRLNTPLREAFPVAALETVLSLAAAWWVLVWLRRLGTVEQARLTGVFRRMFRVCGLLLTGASAFGTVRALCADWTGIAQGNTAAPDGLGVTFAVLVLLSALRFLPDLLAGLTLLLGGELAAELDNGFGQEGVALCERVARVCAMAAQITVAAAAAVNVLQLLLIEILRDASFRLEIPLFTLALSAGLMLLCRILKRGRELQEDSDSII